MIYIDTVPKYLYIWYTQMTNNIEKEASVEDTLEEGPQKLPNKKMFMEKCIARMHNVLDKFKEAWIYWDLLLVF